MITIGLDIAKHKHDIHISCTTNHEVIVDHMNISNNRNGFNSLLDVIQHYNQNDIVIGCEATGHYHFNICDFFANLGFNSFVLNAHNVKLYRDYKGHKRIKNDKIDCAIIAAILADNNYITKFGNKYLRAAIWNAASLIYLHNDTFYYYYNMKKSQGKHHNVVIGHLTKKLVSIIFNILSKNVDFVDQY